jgi:hypothetical protein
LHIPVLRLRAVVDVSVSLVFFYLLDEVFCGTLGQAAPLSL